MALRWNPQTNQFEDDTTGAPFAGQPPPALQAMPPGVGGGAPPQVMPMPAAPPSVVPPPAPPPMERYSSSTTRDIVTPEERATQKRIGQVDQEAVNIAGQKGDVDIQKAKDEAEAAKQRATARQGFEQQTVAGVDQGAAESARAKAVYDAENAKLSTMQIKDYGEDKSAWTKAAAVVSLALGAIGGAMSGRGGNAAVDQLNKVIDDDYRKQRAQIDIQERKVAGAKENVGLVRQSVSDQRADLELKQAARWNSLGGAIDAKAAQNATPAAQAQAAAMKNLAEQKALEHLQRWQEGARAKVTSTNVQGTGAAAGAAGKATSEDLAKIGSLDNDIKNIDRMIATVQKNPQAWNEYRKNEEQWQRAEALGKTKFGGELRGMAQATGFGNISPEQGLKTPEAKQIHQGLQGVRVGIAKGYGGVITGGDLQAAGSEITTLANDPQQAQETLLRVRQRLANSRDVYMQNRNVQANPTAPAPTAGGGQGQGMRQTRKLKDGRTVTGTLLPDGSFQVD